MLKNPPQDTERAIPPHKRPHDDGETAEELEVKLKKAREELDQMKKQFGVKEDEKKETWKMNLMSGQITFWDSASYTCLVFLKFGWKLAFGFLTLLHFSKCTLLSEEDVEEPKDLPKEGEVAAGGGAPPPPPPPPVREQPAIVDLTAQRTAPKASIPNPPFWRGNRD